MATTFFGAAFFGAAARFVDFFDDALRFADAVRFADAARLIDGRRLLDADFFARDFDPRRALADLPLDFLRDFFARAAMSISS
jgi:hypothetical protein